MTVSVVIPCRNAADYIGECLESVRDQTVADWEAVVVDDGSADASGEVVGRYATEDERIRLVRLDGDGRGAAAARNAGIRETGAPLVAFLDADDRWHPDKLARQIAFLDSHEDAVLVAAVVRLIDVAGRAVADGSDESVGRDRPVDLDELLFRSNPLATSSVLARRAGLEAAGLFRERYRIIEDLELWTRVARVGDVWRLGATLVDYRIHDNNVSRDRLTSTLQKVEMWEREILPDPVLARRYGRRLRRRLQRLHWSAGRGLARAGRWDEARNHWRRAAAIDGWAPLAWRSASMLGWSRLTRRGDATAP